MFFTILQKQKKANIISIKDLGNGTFMLPAITVWDI